MSCCLHDDYELPGKNCSDNGKELTMLQFRRPISDCHIHLFNPAQIQECFDMVKTCGYDHWTFLGCTLIGSRALTQNLMGALLKLKGQGQCLAYASFHYDSMQLPDAENLRASDRDVRQDGL